jgi:hypothetical protein
MPYNADLRTGYGKFNFNINWFYEAMNDMNYEVEVSTDFHISSFEYHIEEHAMKYIVVKAFGVCDGVENKMIDIHHENIWTYLCEVALAYKGDDVKITHKESEDEGSG